MNSEYLKQIAENTKPKHADITLLLKGTSTTLNANYSVPIMLDPKRDYVLALQNLETYYSIPNIDTTNNNFKYSPDDGTNWFTIVIPTGAYEIGGINSEIQRLMKSNTHWDETNEEYYVKLTPNTSTLKANLEISTNYQADFTIANSLRGILGFDSQILSSGYHTAEQLVNIMPTSSIYITCNIIEGSFVNNDRKQVIFSGFPNVPPGHKWLESPANLVFHKITNKDFISNIVVTLTDEDGKLINLMHEEINLNLLLRQI